MLTKNIFCNLYVPPEFVDNSDEIYRARELDEIYGDEMQYELGLYREEALVDGMNQEESQMVHEQKIKEHGQELQEKLSESQSNLRSTYHKHHCDNANPEVTFKLQQNYKHGRISQKEIANDAMRKLNECKSKEEEKTEASAHYKVISRFTEQERRDEERQRYTISEKLYLNDLKNKERYPGSVYAEVEKRQQIPLLEPIQESQGREMEIIDAEEEASQTASYQETVYHNNLVNEALSLLNSLK